MREPWFQSIIVFGPQRGITQNKQLALPSPTSLLSCSNDRRHPVCAYLTISLFLSFFHCKQYLQATNVHKQTTSTCETHKHTKPHTNKQFFRQKKAKTKATEINKKRTLRTDRIGNVVSQNGILF